MVDDVNEDLSLLVLVAAGVIALESEPCDRSRAMDLWIAAWLVA